MMLWNLQDSNNKCIAPLVYSNGKSQKDISKEIIETLESYDIVSIQGAVGSGKSVIALQIISHFNSGIIAVPTKVLQRQYVENYCKGNKFHFNQGDKNLRVNFMFGKSNFLCNFMGGSCAGPNTPCNRKLMSGERRYQAASECQKWAPVYSPLHISPEVEDSLSHCVQLGYKSVRGMKIFFCPDDPCKYYKQFLHYTKNGAIIMNLAKWTAETWIGRKPNVPVEVIDEGDTFLDSLSYKTTIGERFFTRLKNKQEVTNEKFLYILESFGKCIQNNRGHEGLINESIIEFLEVIQDELRDVVGTSQNLVNKVKLFLEHPQMAYAQVKDDKLTIFLSRPDVVFSELKDRSGKIILMSATTHSPTIYSSVFKLDNVPMIQAEPKFPGTLKLMFTKDSIEVVHRNWVKTEFRRRYYQVLEAIIAKATRPTLVQVHALKYMPREAKELLNRGFIDGVSWSTVTDRGIDLPDEKCRSIIITKFPFPDLSDIVFKVLQRTFGDKTYWHYIRDMANRELVQQCGRAIRHDNDWCEIWSPDAKVLYNILRLWKGKKEFNRIGSLM